MYCHVQMVIFTTYSTKANHTGYIQYYFFVCTTYQAVLMQVLFARKRIGADSSA
jgi:hypothetical protein